MISPEQLARLRTTRHKNAVFFSAVPKRVLYTARVNNPSITRGAVSIDFDGGAGSHAAAVGEWQEVWVGSAAGADDLGRARIRSFTGSGEGTAVVAANSIPWADNAFLTFIHNYPLKPRYPFIENDGEFKKDKTISYAGQNAALLPVVVAGPHRAFMADDVASFFGEGVSGIVLPVSQSYTLDGATITNRVAYAYPPPPGFDSEELGNGDIKITWNDGFAGQFWVEVYIETDSDRLSVAYRSIYAHSSDPSSQHYPISSFTAASLTGDWNRGGWHTGITVHGASGHLVEAGALGILFQETGGVSLLPPLAYDDEDGRIEDNTLMVGYLRRATMEQDGRTGYGETDFEFTTIENLADNKYMFSISLEAVEGAPGKWYEFTGDLDPGKGIHHFLEWHSTLLRICDVIGLNQATAAIGYVELEDGTLFSMPSSFASMRSIRARLVCDKGGRLHLVEDAQLLPDTERAAKATVFELTKADRSGPLTIIHDPDKRAPFAYASGFSWDGSFVEGRPNAQPHCAIAPGSDVEDDGPRPVSFDRQTFTGQEHCNQIAGRVLAMTNNPYPEARMIFAGNYSGVLDIIYPFYSLSLLSTDTPRGIVWSEKRLIPRQVTVTLAQTGDRFSGAISAQAIFEPEADGYTGQQTECPGFPTIGGDDPPVPVAEELSGGLVTAASVHYLPPQSVSWQELAAEGTLDIGADPWWMVKQDSFASRDAILWRCGVGYIERRVGIAGEWAAMTPGNPPGGTFASCSVIRYEGNKLIEGQHVFLANESGVGSWLLITEDDGETWAWQPVAETTGGEGAAETVYNADVTRLESVTQSPRRAVCGLGSDTVVVVYEDEGELKLRAYSGSWGDVVTITDFMVIDEEPVAVVETAPTICALSGSTFVVAYSIYRLGDNQGIFVRAGSVSGNTITLGDPVSMPGEFGYTGLALSLAALASDKFMIAFRGIFEDGLNIRLSIGELDDLSVTMTGITLTPFTLETTADFVDTAVLDGNTVVCSVSTSQAVEGDYTIQMVVADIDGADITFRDVETIVQSVRPYATIAPLGINTFALIYNNDDDDLTARVCVVSGDSIIPQVENQLDTIPGYLPVACGMSGNRLAVAYIDETGESLELAICNVVSSSITVGESESRPLGDKPADISFVPFVSVAPVGSAAVAVSFCDWQDGETEEGYGTLLLYGAGVSVRSLGMSVGGASVYVTAHDGAQLILYQFSLPGLEALDAVALGEASTTEVNTRQRVAWPLASYFDPLTCYVYGRMSDPYDLEGIYHIIYTADGNTTFVSAESGWGSNHCGTLLEDVAGTLYAVRNLDDGARLHVGTKTGLPMALELPFASPVAVRGLAMFEDGTLYLAAATAVSDPIYAVPPPYNDAVNLTYDHPTGDGINAVEVL